MEFLQETLNTPIRESCDVLVAGAGVAGAAAALAAARLGKSVLLLERGFLVGGLATAGMIAIFLPVEDGFGNKAGSGLTRELMDLTLRCGGESFFPRSWTRAGMTAEEKEANQGVCRVYNPQLYALELEALLLRAGVKLLYGTVVTAVKTRGSRVEAVIAENKSGRFAIKLRQAVDATGDGDLFCLSGAATVGAAENTPLAAWYTALDKGALKLRKLGAADGPEGTPIEDAPRFNGSDGEDLSRFTVESHRRMLLDIREKQRQSDYDGAALPSIPQVRMTRRILGAVTMEAEEARYPDSIGLAASFRKRGVIIELPYRALYGRDFENLLTAGRSLSARGPLWDLCRVIPACITTGQAAGTAAAMEQDVRSLCVEALQLKLREQGVKISL